MAPSIRNLTPGVGGTERSKSKVLNRYSDLLDPAICKSAYFDDKFMDYYGRKMHVISRDMSPFKPQEEENIKNMSFKELSRVPSLNKSLDKVPSRLMTAKNPVGDYSDTRPSSVFETNQSHLSTMM